MSIAKQIEFLWNKALEDAIGAGAADPFAYADHKVSAPLARLRAVERAQAGQRLQTGSRAGRQQAAARRGWGA